MNPKTQGITIPKHKLGACFFVYFSPVLPRQSSEDFPVLLPCFIIQIFQLVLCILQLWLHIFFQAGSFYVHVYILAKNLVFILFEPSNYYTVNYQQHQEVLS